MRMSWVELRCYTINLQPLFYNINDNLIRIRIMLTYERVSMDSQSPKQINNLLPGVLALWWRHLSPKYSKMSAAMHG